MLSILIVDDEQPARNRLRRMMEGMPGFNVVGEAASGIEALERIGILKPHIVLLDISMPGMDGMTLARQLQSGPSVPVVIFCTAYQDQALEAFETQALDYLVKPVRSERLSQALEKARRFIGEEADLEPDQFLRATVGGKVTLTPVHRVICLLAEDKYTTVVFEDGRTVIDNSLTELEKRFPSQFFRIHRNALISRRHIRGLERTQGGHFLAILKGTERKPEVSRRNVSVLRKLLGQH